MAFGLMPWDPFRDIERTMRRTLDWPFGRSAEAMGTPAVEVSDEGDHYLVKAEIPGVPEDEVEIHLTGNVLTIRGEKRVERKAAPQEAGAKEHEKEHEKEEGEKPAGRSLQRKGEQAMARPLFSEVYYGSFERMLTLPDDIDPDHVQADAANGVFRIQIGKKAPQQRSRRISVQRH